MGAAETGVAGYIARWQPSSVSAGAACFARAVVGQAAPGGCQRAKNLLGRRASSPITGSGSAWSRPRRCCCTRR